MKSQETEEKKEDFEMWITFIPDKILELKKFLPETVSKSLNQTIESLDVIERFILSAYTEDFFRNDSNKAILDQFACYIGSTFRQSLPNSYWDIELDDENNIFFGRPVIKVQDALLPPFSPYNLVFTILIRKQGTFLSSLLSKAQQKITKGS